VSLGHVAGPNKTNCKRQNAKVLPNLKIVFPEFWAPSWTSDAIWNRTKNFSLCPIKVYKPKTKNRTQKDQYSLSNDRRTSFSTILKITAIFKTYKIGALR
jgi:hypothetical protein